MSAVTVTYLAPLGDSKVVEMFGIEFVSGRPVAVEDSAENERIINKLSENHHFILGGDLPKRRGRPPKQKQENEAGE